jgi:hypothetical protein
VSPAETIVHSTPPPSVGRIVHFYVESKEDRDYNGGPFPAIVTGSDERRVYVTVFFTPAYMRATGMGHTAAEALSLRPDERLDKGGLATWWSWPPKV